jgi:Tfp pilus assembly protein PilX
MTTRSSFSRRRQSGVVLFIALIVLVAMTLAGIAIMRSVDTGVAISGNVAFKQSTLSAADRGIDDAFQWLTGNVSTGLLNNNYEDKAYYAEADEPDWADDKVWADAHVVGEDDAGNTVSYIIHRMCDGAGLYSSVNCAQTPRTGGAAGNSQAIGGCATCSPPPLVYFRVTVRVRGPRDTMSMVQSNIGLQM